MSHILEVSHQQVIQGLAAKGWSVRHIARTLGINRRTVQRYAGAVPPKCTTEVTTGPEIPPGFKVHHQSDHRAAQFVRRSARGDCADAGTRIERPAHLQDLVAGHGFGGSYPSVRRNVARLKASEPERVWRIECQPGEELQVDFGLGAPLVETV